MAMEFTHDDFNRLLTSLEKLTERQRYMADVQALSLNKGGDKNSPFFSSEMEHTNASAEAEQLYKGLIFDPKSYDERISRVKGLRDLMKEYVALKEQEKNIEDQINEKVDKKHKKELDNLDKQIVKLNKIIEAKKSTDDEKDKASLDLIALTKQRDGILKQLDSEKKKALENSKAYKETKESLGDCAVRIKNCEIEQDNWNKSIESGVKFFNQINAVGRNIKQLVVSLVGDWAKLNDEIHKGGRAFGMSASQMTSMTHIIVQNAREFAKYYNVDPSEIVKKFEQLADATSRVRLPLQNEMEMSAYLHNYGADGLMGAFDQIGGSVSVATARFAQMQKNAGVLGLNLKTAQKTLQDNIGMMNRLTFRGGINGLERMILLSQQLKLNVKDIETMAEKVQDVEGAVQISAQMNALGGSFGANFSNPLDLMYMANYNAEGLLEKLSNTLEGRAVFNEKTGVAEISAMDKRFVKEMSKFWGFDANEMLNSVSRRGVENKIKSQLTDSTLNPTQTAMITNRASFDAQTGRYKVKMSDGSEVDVSQINSQNVSQIVSDKAEDAQLDIRDNVRNIAQALVPYMRDRSRQDLSFVEKFEGAEKEKNAIIMQSVDGHLANIEKLLDKALLNYGAYGSMASSFMGQLPTIISTAGMLGVNYRMMKSFARSMVGGNPQEYMDIQGKQDVTRSYSGKQPSKYEQLRQRVANGEHGERTKQALAKKGGGAFAKNGKWLKKAGIAGLVAVGGAMAYNAFFNKDDEVEEDTFNQTNDNVQPTSSLSTNVNDGVISELRLQTTYLRKISEYNGIIVGEGGSSGAFGMASVNKSSIADLSSNIGSGALIATALQTPSIVSSIKNGATAMEAMFGEEVAKNGFKGAFKSIGGIGAKGALKTMAKGIGPLGALAEVGMLGYSLYDANKQRNALESQYQDAYKVDGYNVDSDYYNEKARINKEENSAIGSAIGGTLGMGLGAYFGPVGSAVLGAVGSALGDFIGGAVSKDGREMQNEDVNKFASEVEGFVSIDDPDLIPKAMLSVIKIHELLAYKWNKDDMKVNSHQTQQTLHAMQVAPTSGGNGGSRVSNVGSGGSPYIGGTTNVVTNQSQTIKLDISGNLKINGSNIDIVDFNKLAHNHEFVNAIISAINQKTQQNPTADSPIGKHY